MGTLNIDEMRAAGLSRVLSQAATVARIKRVFSAAAAANPEISALATGVTVTQGNADDATLTRRMTGKMLLVSGLVAATGGTAYYSDTNGRAGIVSNNLSGENGNLGAMLPSTVPTPPAGENLSGPSYFRFGTDSPKIQLRYAGNAANLPIRLRVDGRYIERAGYDVQTNTYLTLDFGGVRRPRTIEIETNGTGQLFYINLAPIDRLYDPTPNDALRVVQYGDSHVEGANNGASPAMNRWLGNARIYADLIGAWDFRNSAVRASGYVWPGSSGLLVPLSTAMDYSISQKPWDIIEFAAGYNDALNGKTVAETQAGALAAWRKARAAQPNSVIVVWGVWGAATGPSALITAMETGLKAAFDQWADPLSLFIPVSNAADPWETGTGRVGTTNGSGNSDLYVGTDGTHASIAGHEYRGYRRAAAIRQAINAL